MCAVSVWGRGDTACVECSGGGRRRGEELACSGVLAVTAEWMGVRVGSFRWICFHHDSHSSVHVFQTDIFTRALFLPSPGFLYVYFIQPGQSVVWSFYSCQNTQNVQESLWKRRRGIFCLVLYTLQTVKSEAGIDGDSEYVSEQRKRIDAHF